MWFSWFLFGRNKRAEESTQRTPGHCTSTQHPASHLKAKTVKPSGFCGRVLCAVLRHGLSGTPLCHWRKAASAWPSLTVKYCYPYHLPSKTSPIASSYSVPLISILVSSPPNRRQAVNLRLQGLRQGGIMGESISHPGINYLPRQEAGSSCSFG